MICKQVRILGIGSEHIVMIGNVHFCADPYPLALAHSDHVFFPEAFQPFLPAVCRDKQLLCVDLCYRIGIKMVEMIVRAYHRVAGYIKKRYKFCKIEQVTPGKDLCVM